MRVISQRRVFCSRDNLRTVISLLQRAQLLAQSPRDFSNLICIAILLTELVYELPLLVEVLHFLVDKGFSSGAFSLMH